MKERHTRQLEAVYDSVRVAKDHPTADQVHTRVRRTLPSVSLGTVYRNLQKLTAQQRLRVLHLTDRVARYDAMVQPHDHFICERCGSVGDLPRTDRAAADASHLTRAGYAVRAAELTLYGMCPQCTACRRDTGQRAG